MPTTGATICCTKRPNKVSIEPLMGLGGPASTEPLPDIVLRRPWRIQNVGRYLLARRTGLSEQRMNQYHRAISGTWGATMCVLIVWTIFDALEVPMIYK